MNKRRRKVDTIHSLSVYVILSISFVIIYTVAEFIIPIFFEGISHDTLTTCVYAFFGTELGACGFIKIFKLRKDDV